MKQKLTLSIESSLIELTKKKKVNISECLETALCIRFGVSIVKTIKLRKVNKNALL